MTDRILRQKEYFIVNKEHFGFRQNAEDSFCLAEKFAQDNVPDTQRAVLRARYILDNEKPIVFDDEKITLMRTIPFTPAIFTEEEMNELQKEYWVHESGDFNNFAPDYEKVLTTGFDRLLREIESALVRFADCLHRNPWKCRSCAE